MCASGKMKMGIQQRKSISGIVCCVVCVVLLYIVLETDAESKLDEEESLLAYLIRTGEINQERFSLSIFVSKESEEATTKKVMLLFLAELLQTNCRLELLHAKRTLQDLELHFMEKDSSGSDEFFKNKLSGIQILDRVSQVHLQVKHLLLNCLKEKNLMLPTTGEDEGQHTLHTRSLEVLSTQHYSSRGRDLAQAPAPSSKASSRSPLFIPLFSPDSNDPNLQRKAYENPPGSVADVHSSDQKAIQRTVVSAVVATASITFLASTLIFLCCCRGRSGRGRNDEKPLLSLSLSDYSIASSHKSSGFGTSVNEEKLGNQYFNNKLNHEKGDGNIYVESHSFNKLGTPVGTTVETADCSAENSMHVRLPGLPPLRPPPGRMDSPKPLPVKRDTPTPPPPPPIPPVRPPSSSSRPPPPGVPPPPPIPSGVKVGPRPPPPPRPGAPPPRPPPPGLRPPRPGTSGQHASTASSVETDESGASKTKLKPFFWDKVVANPDQSMVWDQIKSGSFQFNEGMIETLFGYAAPEKNKNEKDKESSQNAPMQYIQIIDPKKAQNLSILLKALNVTTEEVCDALDEGNELPSELIQTLLKMAPTAEEELKLRLYSGEISQLGQAERFLKVLVDIPFAFKRLESLLFMCTLQEETSTLKESFTVLEGACAELKRSRLFLKLLEAVLKTGNRMNDGTFRGGAQAFKLDTLLKLSDVKGTDGKTTLLHFVVQEIIRSEGIRAIRAAKEIRSMSSFKSEDLIDDSTEDSDEHLRSVGLQVVSRLGSELENVRKAAVIDADNVTRTVANLGHALIKARDFLNSNMKDVPEENGFHQALKSFVQNAEFDITLLLEEEKRIMALVKSTTDYFHGKSGRNEGLRLFVIVRDFLIILDKVCREVKNTPRKPNVIQKKEDHAITTDPRQTAPVDPRQRLFPAIAGRRMEVDSSSSDDEY